MPYITHAERVNLDRGGAPQTLGQLNYVVTQACLAYLKACGPAPSYAMLNAAIGMLECAKLEFYRRVAAPYEDRKLHDNGDVYPQEVR